MQNELYMNIVVHLVSIQLTTKSADFGTTECEEEDPKKVLEI